MSPKLFRLNTNFNNLSIVLIFTSLIFTACKKETKQTSGAEAQTMGAARFENNGNGWGTVSPDMVLRWNDAAFYLMLNTPQPPPVTPFWSSRYTAMVHIAMHDALNSIVPKYKTY